MHQKEMNKKTINNIYKWWLRFLYTRILIAGVFGTCFSIILIITDYKITDHKELNTFLTFLTGLFGLIFIVIGLYSKTETEYGIRNKWHEKI